MNNSILGSKQLSARTSSLSCSTLRRYCRPNRGKGHTERRFVLLATSSADNFKKRDEVRRLERLLFEQYAEIEPRVETLYERPATYSNLSLWRVEWAVLPSMQEILHVHSPHYVHMFETLFRQPGPWRFGHVYLPGGSKNLDDPQYELRGGSKAPLVGVLMEVSRAVRLMDGKLLVLATAVNRIRVTGVIDETPFCVVDAEALPDEEELAEQRACAVGRALEVAGDECSLEEVMAAASAAARQAAAAAAQVWHRYELAVSRAQHWEGDLPREALDQQDASYLAQELVSHGIKEVLPLPDGPVMGRWDLAQLAADAEVAADLAATCCTRDWLCPEAVAGSVMTPREVFAGLHTTNSVADRGVAVQVAQLEEEGSLGLCGEVIPDLLLLEQLIWQELDAVAGLAAKVHKARISLPLGLLQLRPEPTGPSLFPMRYLVFKTPTDPSLTPPAPVETLTSQGQEAGPQMRQFRGAASGGLDVHADPAHPVLRRTQRLSFALAASFLDNDPGEGRQAFLEAGSTNARLKLCLAMLQRNRKLLAAVSAVMEIK